MNFLHRLLGYKYWLLGMLVISLMTQFSWKRENGEFNTQIISSDGIGYYQYLENYFFNGTIRNQELNSGFMMPQGDRVVNKYFVGAAVCMAPFYKISELHSKLLSETFDPYSPRTKKWINLGSLFYLFLGCYFIYSWLKLQRIDESAIFWSVLSVVLGSNLFLYSVLSPSMTHVYSFFAVAGFIYFTAEFVSSSRTKSLFTACLLFGLIVIIRPINGVVVLMFPFLAGGITSLLAVLRRIKLNTYIICLLLFILPLLLQFYLWYLQTGEWFVWSYGKEGFNWLNPQIIEVLFGFRKGWFVYTPLALLALFGMVVVFKQSRFKFFSLTLLLCLIVYIVSSWWNWYYGSSFGQRAFVDFYAIVAFLLALLLHQLKRRKLVIITLKVFIVGLIGLNLFQSFQYKENIISSWDMTYNKYKLTFGVSAPNQVKIGGSREILPHKAQKELLLDTVLSLGNENQDKIEEVQRYFKYSQKEYGVSVNHKLQTCSKLSRGYYLELEINRLEIDLNSSENAKMIVELKNDEGGNEYYSWFFINEVPSKVAGEWMNYNYQLHLPKCNSDNNQLIVYIRNEDKANFLISRFKLRLFNLY